MPKNISAILSQSRLSDDASKVSETRDLRSNVIVGAYHVSLELTQFASTAVSRRSLVDLPWHAFEQTDGHISMLE